MAVGDVVNTPGRPVEPATRTILEGPFGRDFSQVRIHTDDRAARSARAVGARAYTVGQHIVFGTHQYEPATPSGMRLLAHEVAHTVQQRPSVAAAAATTAEPEASAQMAATLAIAGRQVGALPSTALGIARDGDPAAGDRPGRFLPGGFTDIDIYGDPEPARARAAAEYQLQEERRHDRLMLLRSQLAVTTKPKAILLALVDSQPGDLQRLRFFGLKMPGFWTKQLEFNERVREALDRYDADWRTRYSTGTAPVMSGRTDADDRAFARRQQRDADEAAGFAGYEQATESFGAAAGAQITRQFTDDPKKIAAGAGMGGDFTGVLGAFGTAKANQGSYVPDVERSPSDLRLALRAPSGPARVVEQTGPTSAPRIPSVPRPIDVTGASSFPGDAEEPIISMRLPETEAKTDSGGSKAAPKLSDPRTGRRIRVPSAAPRQPGQSAPPESQAATDTASTDPVQPETGMALERRVLGADKPEREATPTYYAWEGGSRGSLGGFANGLRGYGRAQGVQIPRLARKVLAQPTRDFINANGGLRSFWDAEVKVLTDDAARVRTAMRDADPVTRRDLDRQQAAIQKKLAGLNDWANAPVQSKRPDLVEVWAAERRVVITDITQRPFDPAHNFKMSFYIEAIKALTGWTDVSGVEYKSPTVQKTVGSP